MADYDLKSALKRVSKRPSNFVLIRIKEAIAGASPAAKDLKVKASEAGVLAKSGDFVQANRLLDEAEALLKTAAGSVPSSKTSAPGETKGPAAGPAGQPAPKIAYAQTRLAWDGARKRARADVVRFEQALLEMFKADQNFGDLQTKVRKLDSILADACIGGADCLVNLRKQDWLPTWFPGRP